MTDGLSSAIPAPAWCESCGRPEAILMGGRHLCLECISIAGSCCPEFGAWDAWSQDEGVAPRCFVTPGHQRVDGAP